VLVMNFSAFRSGFLIGNNGMAGTWANRNMIIIKKKFSASVERMVSGILVEKGVRATTVCHDGARLIF
jgi:hypothetical protein